jgi:hypothetical protein
MLAARVVRAGLIWRHAGILWKYGTPSHDGNLRILERNVLERGVPRTGIQEPQVVDFFRRRWPAVRTLTGTDRFRVESMLSVLWQAREVEGDIVECGSYRCGLGFLFAFAVQDWGLRKKVHLYDSFEGLPPLTEEDQADSQVTYFHQGQFASGNLVDSARSFLEEYGLADIVELHKGWFDQTLPLIPFGQRFCFAHIDCDLYESAQTCWTHLLPRMHDGAGIVIDDYDSYGMYKATWDYLSHGGSAAGAGRPLSVGALKQAHFFAGQGHPSVAGSEDWSPLLANRPYCAYLAGLCADMILACGNPPGNLRDEKLIDALNRLLGAEHSVPFLERFVSFLYQYPGQMASSD